MTSEELLCASLFRDHVQQLVSFARLLGASDPESTVQEAYLQLHAHASRLRNDGAGLPYLRTVIINAIRSEHRRQVVARRLPLFRPSLAVQSVADVDSHDELIIALRTLTPRHREALVLRYWLDLSERQMALEMRVSAGTVKAHLSRGLSELRERLEAEEIQA